MLLTRAHSLACNAYAEAEEDVTSRHPNIFEPVNPIAVLAHASEVDMLQL